MVRTQGGADGETATPSDRWRVSSFCAGNGDCVGFLQLASGHVAIRDTKDLAGPTLTFDAAGWQEFVAGVRAGEFDA